MLAATASPIAPVLTLFVVRGLRIFFATRHRSLRDAIGDLTTVGVAGTLVASADAMRRFGIPSPVVALAALNPHGGEDGLFGREEIDILRPAVADAVRSGVDARGPYPADSVFHHAAEGRFDAVVSLYHDQGHIAAKMHDFHGTVAITTGLPFVRSSVDHGTAFDIAGTGAANESSMVEAIRVGAAFVLADSSRR
jgi:4-hydroxythreonine-4-phosphate dehydrogenase